jgi:hypothetical protein
MLEFSDDYMPIFGCNFGAVVRILILKQVLDLRHFRAENLNLQLKNII